MHNLQYYDQLCNVMEQSGNILMKHFGNNFQVFAKHDGTLVTTVDFENEKFLLAELAKIVPQAGFLAEESGFVGARSDLMWVIDPLDGTRNFIKGIPHFCIMVALAYKDEPIVSAIYMPVTKQLYYAEKGKGLWLQGKKIDFTDTLIASKSAIVICSDQDFEQAALQVKENKIQISRRYFGSAGIDAIYLAIGNIDFVVMRSIAWWDVAAGMLLIQEAGKLLYSYEKSLTKTGYGTLKAGNKLFFNDCSW